VIYDTMNTSPHPKQGEALETTDRQTFMKNVAIRAKAMQRAEVAKEDSMAADTQGVAAAADIPRRSPWWLRNNAYRSS
jgi:hypothetical protein